MPIEQGTDLSIKEFEGNNEDWDNFLSTLRGGTIFHQSDWLTILQNQHNFELKKLGFYKTGQLVGLLPLFVKKVGLARVASSPFYMEDTPYLGFAVDEIDINEVLEAIYHYMSKNRLKFIRIVQKQDFENLQKKEFLEVYEKHTHILEIDRPVEELWKNLEGRCRTAIRKAEKCGIEISLVSDVLKVEDYYRMLQEVYGRQQLLYPHPLKLFVDMFNKYNGTQLYILLAEADGKIISGGIFVMDKETVYYLNGAALKEYNNTGVNNYLQWTSILHAHKMGIRYYDFVGSDQIRFGMFKKSFGGDLHRNLCIELTGTRTTAIIRKFYPALKKVCMKYLRLRI